ncbi:MAG: hypothetical protein ACLPSH_10655 [Vulcanimicrobiaceae bacterium]
MRVTSWIVLAGWGIYAAAMLWLAVTLNIWTDEAYTLRTTSSTISHALGSAIGFEQNAPLYFILMWAWRRVSASVIWARLFSLSCAAAAIVVVAKTLHRSFPRLDTRLLLLTLGLAPELVWSALTIRLYALSILLVALFTYIVGVTIAQDSRPTARQTLALAAVATVGIYTAYSFGILFAGFGCALVVLRRWRALVAYAVAMLVASLAFLPLLALVRRTVAAYTQTYDFHPSLATELTQYAWFAASNLAGLHRLATLVEKAPHRDVVGIALLAALCCALALLRKRITAMTVACALATAVSLLLLAIVSVVEGVEFFANYLAFLLVPSFVAVAGVLDAAQPATRSLALTICCAVALALDAGAFVGRYHNDANPGDWRRVASYLQGRERAGEPVLVFTSEEALPLRFYYAGPNRLIPIPSQPSDTVYDSHDFVLRNGSQIDAALEKAGESPTSSLWLVREDQCSYGGVAFGCDALERWISARYDVVARAAFYESSVLELRRR